MGSAERREREREAMRASILNATRAILTEQGYDALTMRAVAERIEYSPAALYKHFTDKDALVRALCAHDFYVFAQTILDAKPAPDPMDRLRALHRAYVKFAITHPVQYRMMFMMPPAIDSEGVFKRGDPEEDAYATLEGVVDAAMGAGHFAGLEPQLVAQTIWGCVHGLVSLEIVLHSRKVHIPFRSLGARSDMMLDTALLGLAALSKRTLRAKANAPVATNTSPKRRTRV
jgi:AcrR family transcriptional regulator